MLISHRYLRLLLTQMHRKLNVTSWCSVFVVLPRTMSTINYTARLRAGNQMMQGSNIRGCVIGCNTFIAKGCHLEDSMLMGNDNYTNDRERVRAREQGMSVLGIGMDLPASQHCQQGVVLTCAVVTPNYSCHTFSSCIFKQSYPVYCASIVSAHGHRHKYSQGSNFVNQTCNLLSANKPPAHQKLLRHGCLSCVYQLLMPEGVNCR